MVEEKERLGKKDQKKGLLPGAWAMIATFSRNFRETSGEKSGASSDQQGNRP
jgi:hypothetical protein